MFTKAATLRQFAGRSVGDDRRATHRQSAKGPVIRWDELDLRRIEGKEAQIAAIKRWGKLRSLRVKTI